MPSKKRDDFPAETKRRLALRAGHRCSFPECEAHTAGPSDEANDAVNNVGVAAHIAGAAPGARRYDASMTPEERSSIENGIWLCQTHAKLIDGDETTWTVPVLQKMKTETEARAKARIGQQVGPPSKGITIEGAACVYIKSYRAAYVEAMVTNESATPITIKSVQLRLGDEVLAPNKPRENLFLNGCDWLPPGPLRLQGADAVFGAWFFGWSSAGGGRDVEAAPGTRARLKLVPVGGSPISIDIEFVHPDDPSNGESHHAGMPQGEPTAAPQVDHLETKNQGLLLKDSMYSQREVWERHLSRTSVMDYLERNSIPSTDVHAYDFHGYINALLSRASHYPLIPRSLKKPGCQETSYRVGALSELSLPFDNNAYYFIKGWGGRGKTSLLNLIAIDLLQQFNTNKRLPIIVSAKWIGTSLFSALAEKLQDTVRALGNVHTLKQWIRNAPTVIAIDDWEKVSDEARDGCIEDIEHLRGAPCAIIIASRNHIPPLHGFTPIDIEGFSGEEQVQFVQHALNIDKEDTAKFYLEQAPDGLRQLLAEPIVLSKYVELFEAKKWNRFAPPQNLPALLDAVIESIVTTQRSRALLHADEINDVCAALSTSPRILRLAIQKNLQETGSRTSVDAFIAEMLGMGIWVRTPLGSYEYSHDLWFHHFAAKACFRSIAKREDLSTWLSQVDPETQRFDIILAAGLLRDRYLQDEFFDWLLAKNPGMYLYALKGRASTLADSIPSQLDPQTKKYCMEQIAKGYEIFVNQCVPGMKRFLDPWKYHEGWNHGHRLEISGDLTTESGRFFFGLSTSSKRNIKIGRKYTSYEYITKSNISAISWGQAFRGEMRLDSGRLLAVQHCLDQLGEAIKKWQLPPVEWIGREAFIDYACDFCDNGWIGKIFNDLSVTSFRQWLFNSLPGFYETSHGERLEVTTKSSILLEWHDQHRGGLNTDSFSVQELIDVADSLINSNLGDSLINNLRIPGHGTSRQGDTDSNWTRTEDRYTLEEKVTRIKALLEAGALTYSALCRSAFAGLSSLMVFMCGPFRGRALVEDTAERGAGILWWWEPTATWGLPAQVELLESTSGVSSILADVDLPQQYADMNRPSWASGSHWGRMASWNPQSRAVTELVLGMLQEDIRRIRKIITSSH